MCDAVKGHHVVPQTFQVLPDAVVPQDTSCCLKPNVVVESTYRPMVGHQPCCASLSIIKLDLSVISFLAISGFITQVLFCLFFYVFNV